MNRTQYHVMLHKHFKGSSSFKRQRFRKSGTIFDLMANNSDAGNGHESYIDYLELVRMIEPETDHGELRRGDAVGIELTEEMNIADVVKLIHRAMIRLTLNTASLVQT